MNALFLLPQLFEVYPHIRNLQRVDFEGARHELMRELPEVTDALWQHIDAFLARVIIGFDS